MNTPNVSGKKPRFDFSGWTKPQRRTFRLFAALMVLVLIVAALGAFFLVLRGAERTMVPDVRGMDLAEALVKLQDRELYPKLSLRFTDNPADRNTILEQTPAPGSIVKAGRRIQITVSRGAVLDRIENYVGKDLEEVKLHLQSLFAASRPLVTVREPPVYVYDDKAAGTILEQKPIEGTEIAGPTVLELVVSRGPEIDKVEVPSFVGMSIAEAIAATGSSTLPVDFSMRAAKSGETPGKVVAQDPPAATQARSDSRIKMTIAAPDAASGTINGVYVYSLPVYPYPVSVRLDVLGPDGKRSTILSVKHPGGAFSAPFSLKAGSTLVLSVLDKEIARSEVK
ncbi:MAG: PASTA domain-containing protein [Rectinema sp.]